MRLREFAAVDLEEDWGVVESSVGMYAGSGQKPAF